MHTVALPLTITPEVAHALADGTPVVALESTVIAQGLPAPRNLETAVAMEQAVRAGGAIPATIAVLDGRVRIGLEAEDLELLATSTEIMKLSTRDLPVAIGLGRHGATTVAATMACAALARIPVFATGGIGGVHRGAETSFDISADIEELARSPIVVVSAGAKSILDLPKTLEALETRAVTVLGYGTDRFPAFHRRDSGLPLAHQVDTAAGVAAVMRAHRALDLPGGILVCNPIPANHELDAEVLDAATRAALAAAGRGAISGGAVTPALLAHLAEATGGASLEANIALLLNNARAAASIAAADAQLRDPPVNTPAQTKARARVALG